MTDPTPSFSWRSIILPAYLPTLLFSIGEGAIIPVIPVVATDRGASLALAGLIAAMLMVGELAGDLPAGWLVARIGERNAMIGASMLELIDNREQLAVVGAVGWDEIAIGFVVSFVVALVVIRGFVAYVSRHGFAPFAWYRIVAGAAAVAWLGLR